MQRIIRFSSLFILALALASVAAAQTTSGSIAGNINDPNSAAIGGATVRISQTPVKASRLTATTDNDGRFVFPTCRRALTR